MSLVEVPAVGTGASTKKKEYTYSLIYVDERASQWTAAKTVDGKVL